MEPAVGSLEFLCPNVGSSFHPEQVCSVDALQDRNHLVSLVGHQAKRLFGLSGPEGFLPSGSDPS